MMAFWTVAVGSAPAEIYWQGVNHEFEFLLSSLLCKGHLLTLVSIYMTMLSFVTTFGYAFCASKKLAM